MKEKDSFDDCTHLRTHAGFSRRADAGDEQAEASLEIRGFLGWLEGFVGAKVEDLTPKNKLQSYYEHDFESFQGVLKKNRKKLAVDPARREPAEALKAEFDGSLSASCCRSWSGSGGRTG